MKVRVNCPIAGCGIQVQVQGLPKHIENVHKLDGEIVLRLHPINTYTHQPEMEPEAELEAIKPSEDAELIHALPIEPEAEPETEPVTEPEE